MKPDPHPTPAHEAAESPVGNQAPNPNLVTGDFLASFSYEIRNPINGIVGAVSLLQDTELTSEQDKYVRLALRSCEALWELVNDFTDLYRIEANEFTLVNLDFSPRRLVENAVRLMDIKALEKGLRIKSEFDPQIPNLINADPVRLRQILLGLASNAIKFTAAGEIVVTVKAAKAALPGELKLHFSVRDTGGGIPPEKLATLFDRKLPADPAAPRFYGGDGLGLFICKQLAERMGGAMGAASTPGVGSEFYFEVTARKSHSSISLKTSSASTYRHLAPLNSGSAGHPKRVLVVDDVVTNQLITCGILKKLGVGADVVQNGQEAVSAAVAHRYDLILMDLKMPVMDGYQATQLIRRAETGSQNPVVPIIALTAKATPEEKEKCLSHGLNDFLTKPIQLPDLVAALKKWLHSPTPEPRTTPPIPNEIQFLKKAVFNREALLARVAEDEDLAREIAGVFLRGLPGEISVLQGALARRDAGQIAFQAHTMKEAAANVSADAFANLMDHLEKAGKSGCFEDIERFSAVIDLLSSPLLAALKSYCRAQDNEK